MEVKYLVVVFVIILVVNSFVCYSLGSQDTTDKAMRLRDEFQVILNVIVPFNYRDTVSLYEDAEFIYVDHSVNITLFNETARSWRLVKNEFGAIVDVEFVEV